VNGIFRLAVVPVSGGSFSTIQDSRGVGPAQWGMRRHWNFCQRVSRHEKLCKTKVGKTCPSQYFLLFKVSQKNEKSSAKRKKPPTGFSQPLHFNQTDRLILNRTKPIVKQ
jgi:hypothetical protein